MVANAEVLTGATGANHTNWAHTLNMRETFGENWEGPAAHSENAPSATYRTSADLEPYWDGDLLPIIEDANFESRAHFQVFVVLNIFMLTEEIVVW